VIACRRSTGRTKGATIATAIARAVAAVGLSATFFQDLFGLVTFDERFEQIAAARPRVGRSHVLYCLDVYQAGHKGPPSETERPVAERQGPTDFIAAIENELRRTSMVPVISDFLFPDASGVIAELALLNAVHDVFLAMADVRFAYELPPLGAGWVEVFDVESGRTRVLSRRELRRLAERASRWQDEIAQQARDAGLDVVRIGLDRWQMETALVHFTAERRLRKV